MRIQPIPCLSDNYAYLVECEATGETAIVDPSEEGPVVAVAKKLSAIWSTHHHFDHVGGNEAVIAKYGIKDVYGHKSDKGRIPGQTKFVDTGDSFTLGKLRVRTIHIPGHTLGAVAYVVEEDGQAPAVFTGDTMFLAGCGRLFEGTPAQMHASLSALMALPPETRVYCGHEYTESNLRFAAHCEPTNGHITRAQEKAASLRAKNEPTVPGTLAEEAKTNPFVRVRSPELRRTLGIPEGADDAEALRVVREAKNNFK
jgi:hydroxyacylglutathione hydrolase